jgi:hypothetical protein
MFAIEVTGSYGHTVNSCFEESLVAIEANGCYGKQTDTMYAAYIMTLRKSVNYL